MQLLQIPPAVPLLSILSVRTRVLIDREYAFSADIRRTSRITFSFSGVSKWCSERPIHTTLTGSRQSFSACTKSPSYKLTEQLSTRSVCSAISSAERETSMP